ncbi:DUF1514 family protein [Staphylococcus pseudintermedius]|uniref:DUF1514 family protein n=1 Tax=Staphylococcus TaxID=1279 RepID=UPI0009E3218F|nr:MULTISPECIES: DUF1514 family protein [Staphylococcus]EGQ0323456.1 DUF1514 domain-containing protein [Staphylococcus pseudintermedius]EGQ0327386.1 DUF1514 domain-containing protein [Staphylococcus pseudintermedius]EGQ0391313.1 DUF1514 domain-containing protein [Staphylococcus pseudintermedius]EGQ1274844.1 DUF1514 domain-containing protein [Staphylococcus pseudintermedius]EGQ1603509.1 DUF1514 domain-containing protein [Staphylococcus pseudintermedius]
MWIITTIILALIALILLAENSALKTKNESLKYTIVYLQTKFKDDVDYNELKRITDQYK